MLAANPSKERNEENPLNHSYSLDTKAAKPWTQSTFTTMWPYLITAKRVTNAITPVVMQSIPVNS